VIIVHIEIFYNRLLIVIYVYTQYVDIFADFFSFGYHEYEL